MIVITPFAAKAALAGAAANMASSAAQEDLHLVCTSAQRMCAMMVAGQVVVEIIPTIASVDFCRAQAAASALAASPSAGEGGDGLDGGDGGDGGEGGEGGIGDYLRDGVPEGVRSTYARALPNLLREGAGGGIFPESGGIFP